MYAHLNFATVFGDNVHEGKGFALNFMVVRYDSRGSGLSERIATEFTLEERIADLSAVADHLKLAKFVLLAGGNGTPLAIAYAAAYPGRVAKMVLLNPYSDGGEFRRRMKRYDSLRETAEEEWESYSLTMANINFNFANPERARELARQLRESISPQALKVLIETQGKIDVRDVLPVVTVPTLVIRNEGINVPSKIAWMLPPAFPVRSW